MSSYSSERIIMVRAAKLAGQSLLADFARLSRLPISEKGPSDFVSSADIDAQNVLRTELASAFPSYGFLLEEAVGGDAATSAQAPSDARFIIDPLDGTTNFLHGIPHFAVSVAFELQGEVVAGVVLNPTTSEVFWAERGGGSWLGEQRLHVSTNADIARAVVGTGIPHLGRPMHDKFLTALAKIMPQVAGVRRLGSAALDLAYVAAGRFDMFWEIGLSPWDIAAGTLLVQEAGGIVTACSGEPLGLGGPDILAASSTKVHERALVWLADVAAP